MTDAACAPDRLDERYVRLRLVSPVAERSIRESLEKVGQLHPLVTCPREGVYAVVDGFKRLHAARALGLSTLRVRVLELSETAAIAAVMRFNRPGRGLSDLEEALCVRALVREQGLTQVAVGELLGRDKSWVSRRLTLAERLCETVAGDVRAGLLTTTVAREVARLPRGNQPEVAAAIMKASLTSREGAELVALFDRSVDGPQRRYLLAHPREALAAHGSKLQEPGQDPRLGPVTQVLRQRLYGGLRTMSDLTSRLSECTPSRWTDTEREVLGGVVDKVHGVAQLLTERLSASRAALGEKVTDGT